MLRSLSQDMLRFGNLATRTQLRELGYSAQALRNAVAARTLFPIRRSWLAAPGAQPNATRAVALDGRLAAASALESHGVWVSRPDGLWIASPRTASRLPATQGNEHRLWCPERFPRRDDRRWRMSVGDALLQYLRVGEQTDVVASVDSALNKSLVTPEQLDEIFAAAPRRVRRLRKRANAKADSGLETIVRLACEAAGWSVEVQVYIRGVGHVDLLIDGWLVIELDGGRWHDDDESRDEDARRDAEVTLLGYRYHHFRYNQVMNDLPLCLDVITAILADGRPVVA